MPFRSERPLRIVWALRDCHARSGKASLGLDGCQRLKKSAKENIRIIMLSAFVEEREGAIPDKGRDVTSAARSGGHCSPSSCHIHLLPFHFERWYW